jgi:hypothetical protein
MKALVALFLLALALVLGGTLAQPIVQRWEDKNAYQRTIETIQAQDYRYQTEATATSRALTNAAAGPLALIVGMVAVLVVLDYYRQRREPVVRVDGIPLARRTITSDDQQLILLLAERIRASGIAAIEVARRPLVPAHLNYAPHYASRNDLAALGQPLLPPPSADSAPTFAQLLDGGRVGRDNPLLLGFDAETGQELAGTWKDLYSAAIAGVSGSGKTTTVRFLAAQSALHGARWVLLDPHADTGDDSLAGTLAPLSSTFLCAPATNARAMLSSVQLVAETLDRRLHNTSSERWPLVLAADEFTSLMRGELAEPLAALIERIAQEGRKVLVFALVSGQVWTAERTGGSALRDSLASCYVHRMKRRQANHLLQLGDELPETLTLATGHALLYRTSGELVEVTIPNTTSADVERVANLLGSGQAPARPTLLPKVGQKSASDMPSDMPGVCQSDAQANLAYSAPASAEALRVAQLFQNGMDLAAIVLELRGVRSSEGKRYQVALSEVQALLRAGLRGVA